MSADLEQIITDSVNDSINDVAETPDVDVSSDTPSEPVEASETPSEPEQVDAPAPTSEVPSPAATAAPEATPAEPQDEFAKLVGVPQVGVGGRENRIPYSRVKKITEKAATEAESKVAEAVLGRKLNAGEKAIDIVKAHVAKLPELETKVADYESRLTAVGQFEDVMANDPQKFLGMLAKMPVYRDFFDFVEQGSQALRGQQAAPAQAGQPAATNAPAPDAGMPEPDEELSDGSKVYSMDGLKALLAWQSQQTESRVTSAYEKQLKDMQSRYEPIANDWQERRRAEAVIPIIQKQIADARTWTLFNESESEILDVLRKDKTISLEGAYRQVVFPKLVAERSKIRQEVIQEVKSAPTATSITPRAASKPAAANAGPRTLEDVIREQVAGIKR
jgi:hypothetical protein